MPSLSIIIPTHKRPQILRECLRRLERQTIAKDLEVIVVSDGPGKPPQERFNIALQYFEIPKSQQGIARNRGVDRATAPVCLFIGDDIFLEPDACEKHVQAHSPLSPRGRGAGGEGEPRLRAVLGFTTWDPSLEITPVMRWLEKSGWQFGYPQLTPYAHREIPQDLQHRFTYTSNISVPTTVAKKIRFREDVNLYGWEDIEWGMRLRDAGVSLFYEPAAKAFHHHRITLEDSLKRMEEVGKSAMRFSKIDPTFDRVPKGWKRFAYRVLSLLPTMRGRHAKAFLQGLDESTV